MAEDYDINGMIHQSLSFTRSDKKTIEKCMAIVEKENYFNMLPCCLCIKQIIEASTFI